MVSAGYEGLGHQTGWNTVNISKGSVSHHLIRLLKLFFIGFLHHSCLDYPIIFTIKQSCLWQENTQK